MRAIRSRQPTGIDLDALDQGSRAPSAQKGMPVQHSKDGGLSARAASGTTANDWIGRRAA